jgi:hypothetical protein
MNLRRDGVALPEAREALAAAIPDAGGKLLVLLHGLCMNDLQWKRKGHDHGAALARDLAYTPVYLRYNSGLHVSTNGRMFAEGLEALVRRWPVPLTELVIIERGGNWIDVLLGASVYTAPPTLGGPRHQSPGPAQSRGGLRADQGMALRIECCAWQPAIRRIGTGASVNACAVQIPAYH